MHPGKFKIAELEILPEKLKYFDINIDYVVDPGEFTVMNENSLADKDLKEIKLIV